MTYIIDTSTAGKAADDATAAIDLLTCAEHINRSNVESFERRLQELRAIICALRQGRDTPEAALKQAERLGFVAPLISEEAA